VFLEQMGDQACGAGQDRHALERRHRIAHVEQHRGNRPRHVQRQRPADELRQQALDRVGDGGVRAGRSGLAGDLE
jgi:hypothetical protein